MTGRFQMIDELFNQTYPVHSWAQSSSADGKMLREVEQNDNATALTPKNAGFGGGHVEGHLETTTGAWQPWTQGQEAIPVAVNQAQVGNTTMNPEATQNDTQKAESHIWSGLIQTNENTESIGEPQASEASVAGSAGADQQHGQTNAVELNESDRALIQQWGSERYGIPNFFGLLLQIAKAASDPHEQLPITTERLLARSTMQANNIRVETFRFLKTAWNLGLLNREGELGKNNGAGSIWSLTEDGRRYLLNGVRARVKLRNVSALPEDSICQQLTVDEIEDWELELRERNRLLNRARTQPHPDTNSSQDKPAKKRLPSKLSDEPVITKAVSRAEFVQAIEESAISQAKNSDPGVGGMWSGLVR